MTTTTRFRSLALPLALLFTTGAIYAQNSASSPKSAKNHSSVSITPKANETEPPQTWNTQQIVTCTVSECWQLSGKNEDAFFDIVQQLAAISAHKRGLVLPDSAEAGRRAGEYIKAKARADHDQLLYAVVDDAVRRIGKPGAAGKPAATN